MQLFTTRFLTLAIGFMFCTPLLFAQNGLLSGKVVEVGQTEGLIGATIQTAQGGTITDYDGNFQLELAPGTHVLTISYVGYQAIEQSISMTAGGAKTLNFELSPVDNMLQTAVVTTGKHDKPLSEATVSIEVLKPRLIEAANTSSAKDILLKIPGLDVADGQPSIRSGAGWSYGAGSRVLLLMDDIPILQADAGFPNWDDMPIESVEQIEVVKGAASALYGSSAMNGIINLRTAYAKSEPVTKLATWGTFWLNPEDSNKNWWDEAGETPYSTGVSLSHRQKFGKLDVVAGGFFLDENSFRKDEEKRYGRFNFSTRYRLSDRLTIALNGNFNKGRSDTYFYWARTECECGSFIGDTTTLGRSNRLRYTLDPSITYFDNAGNQHKFLGRFYHIDNDVQRDDQSNSSDLFYGEYQFQKRWDELDLVLTAGLTGTYSRTEALLYGDTSYNLTNNAVYLQLEKKFSDRLTLSGGVRYERNELDGPEEVAVGADTISLIEEVDARPVLRIGANYEVGPATFLRASWGQGYRFPTIAEKYISTQTGGIIVVPNPALRSETGQTFELGIKQGFKVSDWTGYFDAALFQSEYQDMMEFSLVIRDFAFAFQSTNVGDVRIRGVDLTLAGQGKLFGKQTYVLAGYTFSDPRFVEFDTTGRDIPITTLEETGNQGQLNAARSSSTQNILKYRNQHTFKIDIESELYKGFSLGFATIYKSRVDAIDRLLDGINDIGAYRAVNDGSYVLMDARASYTFDVGLKVSLLMNNVLNEEYTTRPGVLEAPRSISVRADVTF